MEVLLKQIVLVAGAAALSACSFMISEVDKKIVAAVQQEAGGSPELQFSRPMWCSQVVEGKRAAMVAAVGPVQAGATAGAGGYLVEVLADGTVLEPVKAAPADPYSGPSRKALKLDRTYCEGKLVAGPYEAMEQLRAMRTY